MTAEFGVFFLILALLVALVQAAYLIPTAQKWILPTLPSAAWLQSLLITLAFATLMILRLDSDFSVVNVIEHSNRTLPTLYKIAGTWGNHEGSMLLWIWVLAIFGVLLSIYNPAQRTALAVQAAICSGFLLFILCTSNPFARTFPPVKDGEALNPLLQDIGLAMHPPLLYLGYVGFSMVFSLAVAALLKGRMDREWAETAHPWILGAWSALTIGIGLGSWWAYRVLGWGGFWFWDPVENASLLPWLSGTALLHSNIVLKKRGLLAPWVILLSIITFGLSLLGTFLTRSGVLISVHSFASDPTRGMFILIYITLIMGVALALFALRAGNMQVENQEKIVPLSREGMILINNLFLLTACATVLLGTLYPMLADIFAHTKISVGAPYFNITCLPILAVPLLFAGLAAFMPWKHAPLKRALMEARPALMAALVALLLILSQTHTQSVLAALGFGLSAWLAMSSLRWLKYRGNIGVFLGHMGAAVLVIGITGAGLWQQELMASMKPGDSKDIAGYHIMYTKESAADSPNYHGVRSEFSVTRNGDEAARLAPEYRLYDIAKSSASIAAIDYGIGRDLYINIGKPENGVASVRLYYNPLMSFIWAGCLLMAAGGIAVIVKSRR
jgi:cytochrome c-type biogenesis protein CcmF